MKLLSILVTLAFFGCGIDAEDLEKFKDDLESEQDCVDCEDISSTGEDYSECTDKCSEKESNKNAEIVFLDTTKVYNPLSTKEKGVNSIVSTFYSVYEDKFYFLKQEVKDDLGQKYYPIDSAYCSLDNIVREDSFAVTSPYKQIEGFFKVGNTEVLLGLIQGSGSGLWALAGTSPLELGDHLANDPPIGLYSGLHFMFYHDDNPYYVKVPEDLSFKGTVCEMDFYSSSPRKDCKYDSDNPVLANAVTGTYFKGRFYILNITQKDSQLMEYNVNSKFVKSYKISSLDKSKEELRKTHLLADLENIYFVTIENDYLVFDKFFLSQKAEE